MDHGGNGMPGGMLPSNMGSGGLLGLDMSLHPHQQQMHQQPKLHHQLAQQQAHHMLPFQTAGDVAEHHPLGRRGQYLSPFARDKQQPAAQTQQQPVLSSEEEPGNGEAEPADDSEARRSLTQQPTAASLWQRMKWTDSMVRLLIQVVYRIGDDAGGGAESEQQQQAVAGKGKGKAGTAAALLQKKGKWKSVSRAMMEKGFSVSPQQCEDKFNDLNKRYKRVNDLLGKGTACRVVENQALLDTMDHLSRKAKEEARKLLNSKHLFFREMCAYHHAGGGGSCTAAASATPLPPHQVTPPPHQDPQQRQLCFHHPQGSRSDEKGVVAGRAMVAPTTADEEGVMMGEEVDDDDYVDSEDDDDFDDEEDEEDEDLRGGNHHKRRHHPHKHDEGEEDVNSKEFVVPGKKQLRASSQMSASPPLSLTLSSQAGTMQHLRSELMAAMSAAGGGEQQQQQHQRHWLRKKAAELEEQRVAFQCRAFQLERQRFKWLRFCTNKEREMERTKLENERLCLENDRMLLLLRQKELELIQSGCNGGFASSEQQLHTANADHPSSATA